MKVKIFATLGPSSLNKKTIADLDRAGVDLFRLNMSHTTVEELRNYISLIRSVTGVPICIDSEGSKKRTRTEDGEFTERDIEACRIGREMGISNYVLSFAESADDVIAYRKMIQSSDTLIAKIETTEGIKNLPGIMERCDSILIDRGDLSISVNLIAIPHYQKQIIREAKLRAIDVYVATNFLGSMSENKVPSIAEVMDVACTLRMGVNGLVLAEETAIGKHPVETAKFIRKLIEEYG